LHASSVLEIVLATTYDSRQVLKEIDRRDSGRDDEDCYEVNGPIVGKESYAFSKTSLGKSGSPDGEQPSPEAAATKYHRRHETER
jgi:hypothetical protein